MLSRAAALRQRGLRAAFNGWLLGASDRAAALALLGRAALALHNRGLHQRAECVDGRGGDARGGAEPDAARRRSPSQQPLRFALNGWIDAARGLAARRALVASFTPELRAARRAVNQWIEVMSQLVMERGALRGVIHELQGTERPPRVAAVARRGDQAHQRRSSLRRGAMAIKHRELRMALNGWIEGADERRAALELMGRAGARSPPRPPHGDERVAAARREARKRAYRMARRQRDVGRGPREACLQQLGAARAARGAARGAMVIKNREVKMAINS